MLACVCIVLPINPHVPQEDYREDSTSYFDLLKLVLQSLDDASRTGVDLKRGGKLYLIPIGQIGDWPYLVA